MSNFVLPYDADRGMIPLIKHHYLVKAPLVSAPLTGRYYFQDATLTMVIIRRMVVLEFSKFRLVKKQNVLCNP